MLDSISHSPTRALGAVRPAPDSVHGPGHEPAQNAADATGSTPVGASDEVSISPQGLAALEAEGEASEEAHGPGELTDEEREQVRELQRRDIEVRAHEQAHLAAAGNLAAGGPSYETQRGPDGRQYAVGGEVGLRTSEGRTPEESLRIAQQVQRAALAPAQPSGQDRAVAAGASQQAAAARAQIAAERRAETGGPSAAVGAAPEEVPAEAANEELEPELIRRDEAYAGTRAAPDVTAGLLGSIVA